MRAVGPTLLRYAPSLLLLGVAVWAWARSGSGDVVVLTGLEHLVGPDPRAQARATWQLLGAVGLLFLAVTAHRHLRERAEGDEDDPT